MATYKESGVDIDKANSALSKIKGYIRSTYNKNTLSDVGSFGGCFKFPSSDYKNPVIVSSADGVGTKLKIAFLSNTHDTIGQCLVNHCTNDILAVGARPLFFLDYFATGVLTIENREPKPSIISFIPAFLSPAQKVAVLLVITGFPSCISIFRTRGAVGKFAQLRKSA